MKYDRRFEKVADILVNYSTKVKKDDRVYIVVTSWESRPLLEAIFKEVIKKKAHPYIEFWPTELQKFFFENANKKQIEYIPEGYKKAIKTSDAWIGISSFENDLLNSVDPKKLILRDQIFRPYVDWRVDHTRWVLTGFPTKKAAQLAHMSQKKFTDMLIDSVVRDWKEVKKEIAEIKRIFDKGDKVLILGQGTKIELSLKNRHGIICSGKENMPDGELFYGPIENSTNGKIYFDKPINYGGKIIKEARFIFKKGTAVSANSRTNKKYLSGLLNSDKGAKKIGEFGIGLNYGIKKITGEGLLDEKIGGTIHLAIGSGYKRSGSRNRSSIHFDMVKDLRRGGKILVDGKLVFKNGKFLTN